VSRANREAVKCDVIHEIRVITLINDQDVGSVLIQVARSVFVSAVVVFSVVEEQNWVPGCLVGDGRGRGH
jgi:hypothetical protein